MFSEAVRSFERFATEFAGVTATAKVCGGGGIAAGLQFVIVLLRRQGVTGASVDVVVIVGSGVVGAVSNGFGLVPSPV